MPLPSAVHKIAFLGDYLPRKCGIATFTTDLRCAVAAEFPAMSVSSVIYTCGALLQGRQLIVPNTMSDSATSLATVLLDELLAAIRRNG
jgi:hypothetical protein